jgi:hypothetical protein
MAGLTVEFEKRKDGDSVLRCLRADGSTTWQHHAGPRGVFFTYHDLTHLAVERTLGLQHGFFGLIAAGWDVVETEGKSARGPLSTETIGVENLVGLFDRERGGGAEWTADEFNTAARGYAAQHGHPAPQPISDGDITRVRAAVRDLHDAWRATPAGATMRVQFGPS